MFIRQWVKSNNLLSKSHHIFFSPSRHVLTGIRLEKFRKSWSTLSQRDKMSIANNQRHPLCGDILITRGDFHKMEEDYEFAIKCYKDAAIMNKDCEIIANKKIAEIEIIKQKEISNAVKRTDVEDHPEIRMIIYK